MKDLFEGVYLKHQKNGESICFIAGRAGETRFVQVITNGTVRQYDGAQGFCFGEEGVAAELPGVQGALRYGPLSPLRTDIMGPFRFLPGGDDKKIPVVRFSGPLFVLPDAVYWTRWAMPRPVTSTSVVGSSSSSSMCMVLVPVKLTSVTGSSMSVSM